MKPFVVALLTLASGAACSGTDSSKTGGAGTSGGAPSSGGAATTGSGGSATSGGSGGTGGSSAGAGGAGASPAADAAGDTWVTFAQSFFKTYCVECHGVGNANRDYTTLADVKRDAATIRCGVAPTKLADCKSAFPPPKQFPISNAASTNPKPTDAERERLVKWIEAGTPG